VGRGFYVDLLFASLIGDRTIAMLQSVSDLVGQVAHIIGVCLMIYAILLVVRGLERGDMIGTIFKAVVMGVASAVLMRI
jgi:hypothetical protein